MKKSTLFFKVMVLLALLVPWAAWGQTDVSTQSFHDDWWENSKTKGTLTLTIDSKGEITDASYSQARDGIAATATVSRNKLSFTLTDWKFDTTYGNNPVISISGWKLGSYFDFAINNSEKTLTMEQDGSVLKDTDKTFKIKVEKKQYGNKPTLLGNIKVVFKKGQTDITNDDNFKVNWSAQGGGSGEYKGAEYSTDELKKELSVKYNGKDFSDYTLTVKDNKTIKDAGEYTLVITPNKDSGLVGSKEISYKVTAKKITITINDQTITLPNDKGIKTEAQGNVTAAEGAIYTGDQVSYAGSIKAADNANVNVPGEYTNGLVEDIKITSQNKNYEVTKVEAGTLIVKYSLDDQTDLGGLVTISGDGEYTYANKEYPATIESDVLGDCLEVWYKEANGEATQETPKHVGEYTVIIKKKADAKCEYVTIPETGITTDKKITISAKEITVTGSLSVEQGTPLDKSYDADKLSLKASETGIEGLTLKFTGTVTPNNKAITTNVSEGIDYAFDAKNAEGWTIDITGDKTYFENGDITIKDVNIKLIVTEKEVDWTDESNAHAEVIVYVNDKGEIVKYGEVETTDKIASILINSFSGISNWTFDYVLYEGQPTSQPVLNPASSTKFTWNVLVNNTKLMISGIDETIENGESVKVKIKNNGEEGYLLVTFAKDETSEEPENPEELEWATGDAQGTVTAYVNPEGQITRVEGDGTFSSGRLNIVPENGWTFAIAEGSHSLPVFSDMFLSKSFTWGVVGNGSLNVYGLDYNESVYWNLPKEVKVQIKNGDKLSYVLIKFEQDDDTWSKDETAAASASVTVYVNTEGKVVSATPKCSIRDGALFIDLDKVDEQLAGWKYSQIVTPEGSVTAKPVMSGDISALFSLMVNNNGDLFVTKETSFDAAELPTTAKVKIENGDKAGYLEIAFEKVIVINPGDITVGGDDVDNDGIIDKNGNLFIIKGTGENTIYDSETHELALLQVAGLDEPLRVVEDYDVVYTDGGTGDLKEDLPYHAGTYTATITLGDKYITTSGAKEIALTVEITKRDLHLAFSIEENATIEDLNEKLDLADGLVICTPNNLAPNDNLAGVITATFTIGQEPVDGLYPVYPETIHFENTADFDREDYNIMYDYTDLEGFEHQGNITPDEDGDVEIGDGEGEIPADDPIGGIEYVDPETGEGSAGGYYEKKYRLYLAVKDKDSYYVEDAEADYKAEGLELFSRRDKKTTWAGGSFTVYYKHNDVVNEGGYRVFIKRGKHADYEEVKLDEVSGYYQIRNVQSDIYVRLYYGTGLPVANEEITATDARAYAQANKIVVITPEPTDVQIISMAGAVVATDQVTGQREFANLAEGVYIVRMGETVIKLQVRN